LPPDSTMLDVSVIRYPMAINLYYNLFEYVC